MNLKLKYFLVVPVILFSLTTAFVIYTKSSQPQTDSGSTQLASSEQESLAKGEIKKSKFSFEIIASPSPLPSDTFTSPSPLPSLQPSLRPSLLPSIVPSPSLQASLIPSPSLSPSPSLAPSPSPSLSPSPTPSPSPSPSVLNVPVQDIPSVPDDQVPDFAYFLTFNEGSFGLSFKYHPEWVISSNNSADKLHFVNPAKISLLQSKIIYAFEDPDYQLGKYEVMQVNIFSPNGKSLVDWLLDVNPNAKENPDKLVYQKINGRQFLRLKDKENQVYYLGPGGKIYSFWFKCADWGGCSSAENKETWFRKILQTVN